MMDLLARFSNLAFTLAGALALAALAYLAADILTRIAARRKASASLQDFVSVPASSDVAFGSPKHKIRAAFAAYGLNVAENEENAFYLAVGLVSLAATAGLTLMHIAPVLSVPGGLGVGYMMVRSAVNGHWERVRREIDGEIPTFMRNLSGIIQAAPNVVDALDTASHALDPAKPLVLWMREFTAALQAHGRGAFQAERVRAHEISSALGVLVYEIERLWESGGQGYARAFQMTADNLGEILMVKGQAYAKTGSAMSTAKIIIAAAVITIGYIISSPSGQVIYLGNPVTKIAILAAVLWGVYGWAYIKTMVREAIE